MEMILFLNILLRCGWKEKIKIIIIFLNMSSNIFLEIFGNEMK